MRSMVEGAALGTVSRDLQDPAASRSCNEVGGVLGLAPSTAFGGPPPPLRGGGSRCG
jgi:hypothetical protein